MYLPNDKYLREPGRKITFHRLKSLTSFKSWQMRAGKQPYIHCKAITVQLKRKLENPLKGLGHAILVNFSIDQVIIELTEITK